MPTRVHSCSALEEFNLALYAGPESLPHTCDSRRRDSARSEARRAKLAAASALTPRAAHARLLSSGCERARSQLVLSCLIGWNNDRGEQRRKEGGGRKACMRQEALTGLREAQTNPDNSCRRLRSPAAPPRLSANTLD